jgi:predicted dehydrogenase
MMRELKYIIENGRIGRLHCIQIEMPQESFKRVAENGEPIVPQKWRLHDGKIPTISLDLGVHLHMIVKYLTGEIPVSVVSTNESLGNFPEVIDNVSCIIEYSNNLICNMWYSKIAIGNRNGLKVRVFGEIGSAEWVQEKPEYLHLADHRGNRWIVDRGSGGVNISNQTRYTRFKAGHPAGFIEAFANYYFDIADALGNYLDNKSHYMNANCFGIEEAIEGLHLLEAISKSSSTKKWERIILTN